MDRPLSTLLGDDYATVRHIAGPSLRFLPGESDLEYDFLAPSEERDRVREQVRSKWTPPQEARSTLLLSRDRTADIKEADRRWADRDQRPVDLKE